MPDFGFQILYDDGPCLAVCKPPGLPTQRRRGLIAWKFAFGRFLKDRDHPPCEVYLGIPHRLDRPASGVMVFATRRRAAHKLSKQFENRSVKKLYWACVEGRVDPPAGTWQDLFAKFTASRWPKLFRRTIPMRSRPFCTIEPSRRPNGARGWRFSWRRDELIKFASKRPRAAIPSSATLSTERRRFSARSIMTSDCSRLHCTLGRLNLSIRRAENGFSSPRRSRILAQVAACGFATSVFQCAKLPMRMLREPQATEKKNDTGSLSRPRYDSDECRKPGIYRLSKLEDAGLTRIAALPYSIRVLLESVLRNCDGYAVTENDVCRLAGWQAGRHEPIEVPFKPARVLLQDFTGVPAVVDLAAMRSAMRRLGGDPSASIRWCRSIW